MIFHWNDSHLLSSIVSSSLDMGSVFPCELQDSAVMISIKTCFPRASVLLATMETSVGSRTLRAAAAAAEGFLPNSSPTEEFHSCFALFLPAPSSGMLRFQGQFSSPSLLRLLLPAIRSFEASSRPKFSSLLLTIPDPLQRTSPPSWRLPRTRVWIAIVRISILSQPTNKNAINVQHPEHLDDTYKTQSWKPLESEE